MKIPLKLYKLTRFKSLEGFDYYKEFIIKADSAVKARKLAKEYADEKESGRSEDWLDINYTSCERVCCDSGEESVVGFNYYGV